MLEFRGSALATGAQITDQRVGHARVDIKGSLGLALRAADGHMDADARTDLSLVR
ncbi:hypothetical protein [Streptomyces sp. NPDC051109]|uniref:hypothetical protein n=1 Tax=Streptomyces sp. NPDC051109 TaxID=3365642 RepID=UPI0037B22644